MAERRGKRAREEERELERATERKKGRESKRGRGPPLTGHRVGYELMGGGEIQAVERHSESHGETLVIFAGMEHVCSLAIMAF